MTTTWVADRLTAAGCVFAAEEAAVLVASADGTEHLQALVDRRAAGEPLEHVVGWTSFLGRRLEVDGGVFVPRPRSRALVTEVAHLLGRRRTTMQPAVLVDLCCGTGALGAYVAASVGTVELHASDCDPRAVACARRNLRHLGGTVHQGDLLDALPAALHGRVDVLMASPPYVPTGDLALLGRDAREWEPRTAFDGGGDGLDVVRSLLRDAAPWLSPTGRVALEVAGPQLDAVRDLLEHHGYAGRVTQDETYGGVAVIGTPLRRHTRPARTPRRQGP